MTIQQHRMFSYLYVKRFDETWERIIFMVIQGDRQQDVLAILIFDWSYWNQ